MQVNRMKKSLITVVVFSIVLSLFAYFNKVNAVDALKTVSTVDTSGLIEMYMFDYGQGNTDRILLGRYGNGNVKQGLLKNKLNSDGMPVTNDFKEIVNDQTVSQTPNQPLNTYFDPEYFSNSGNYINNGSKFMTYAGKANNLFLESTYNATGYYEYSSFQNYAYYDTKTQEFTVYNRLGTPSNEDYFFYKRGNFLPFNNISNDTETSTNRNLYDEDGNELSKKDTRHDEELYLIKNANFFFGMTLETTFAQLEDGKVTYNGDTSDMVYEFNGDDDLWIYIDGVLVLDIGGIHDAHSGKINFNTGDVEVTIDKAGNKHKTTIKECFKEAGVFPDGTDWDDSKVSLYFEGNTFADYTSHTMKMFYMERGAGASNLHMKFNLQLIPEGQIQIGKQLDSGTDPDIYGKLEFGFKLEVQNDEGVYIPVTKEYLDSNNKKYYKKINGEGDKLNLTWNEDHENIFYLQPGEIAYFDDIAKKDKFYKVTEVNVKSDEFDKVTIVGTTISVEGKDETYDVESPELSVSKNPMAMFTNRVDVENDQEIFIYKELAQGQTSQDEYDVKVKIEDSNGNLVEYKGAYFVFKTGDSAEHERKETLDGIIKLNANEYAVIYHILSGTDYKIEEVNLNSAKYDNPIYKDKKSDEVINIPSGIVELNGNVEIKIINTIKTFDLTINKYIKDADFEHGDPIFTFKITDDNNNTYYETVRFTENMVKENGMYKLSFVLEDVMYGDYTIVELDTIRYEACDNTFTNVGDTSYSNKTIKLENDNSIDFYNKLTNDVNYSHTDVVKNKFNVNDDGTITITQDYHKEVASNNSGGE